MSCSAKFPAEFSLSCILALVAEVRNGITPATVKDALWVAGCLIEKVGPATLPPLTGLPITLFNEADDLEALLAEIEAECNSLTRQATTAASPPVGTQGWEVFIPLILELIKLIMENRKKKQQPAPEPSPAPVNSIDDNGSGVVRAPAPVPKKS
jgi:hypothetical protein